MNEGYHGADCGPFKAILVSHRLDTSEGSRRLRELILTWPGVTLTQLDERHVVAVLRPGGALELTR